MKGSVQKRHGRHGVSYLVRVELPPHPVTGARRQRAKSFPTRKAADTALAAWVTEIDRGTAVDPSKLTVAGLLDEWLTSVAAHTVKPKTLDGYAATIRVHIVPTLGNVLAQRLTQVQVQSFYAAKLAAGASPRTVQLCHLRLSQALRQGVSWGLLSRNVCDSVKPPRVTYKRGDTWSVEEATQFLAAAADDPLGPVWLLALTTGMRRGELLGLRWRDLDLDKRTLHVRQTVTAHKGAPLIDTPKTAAARRTIALPPETVTALKEHRRAWLERKLSAATWHDHDLIFCTRDGKPINPANLVRSFTAILTRSELRRIRVHDLRHTHATWLLQAGQPVKVVSERLGHAKVSITLDTYAHVLPAMQDQAVEALGNLLFRPKAS